jgi:Outer membrane protein beta-barrel domain
MRRVRVMAGVALVMGFASATAMADTKVGIISGFCFSNLRIDGQSDLQGRSSFALGAVADFGINDRLGIRVEPTWLAKGTKATHHNAYWGTIDGAVFNLQYIDIPILARYNLQPGDPHAYLLGGISTSIATQREIEMSKAGTSETVDMSGVLKSYDFSLDIGAGVAFKMRHDQQLTIDGRAAFGIININDGGTVTFQGAPLAVPSTSTHTFDFRLFASYLFSLGAK